MDSIDLPFATIAAQSGCADVVFVHGLTGNPIETWTSDNSNEPEGKYWPKWLAADLPHLNLYAIGYPASLFAKWARKEMDLFERAKACLEIMASYGLGSRPVVFIGHSLGGLLIKQMLRIGRESSETSWRQIADRCRGVFFLATPHSGASLANILSVVAQIFKSSHVEKLKRDSSDLTELNESFRAFCLTHQMTVVAYYEKFKTSNAAIVVDQASADPGVSGVTPIPVDASHTSICTPDNRHAPIYVSIRSRLLRMVPSPTEGNAALLEDGDDLTLASETDRRDLQTKMIAAGREHEYPFASASQNKFARQFERNGLLNSPPKLHKNILLDIEQRFQNLVFHPLICGDAKHADVSTAVQNLVIDPLADKYKSNAVSATAIMNALYFLTGRCHLRWDKP